MALPYLPLRYLRNYQQVWAVQTTLLITWIRPAIASLTASSTTTIQQRPPSTRSCSRHTTISSDFFQENWSLIQNLHPIIAGTGIPYHIDLSNEGIPPAGFAAFLQYSQELCNDYDAMFGSTDTLGFSIIADDAHVSQVSTVYGPSAFGNHGSPSLFDIHIYSNPGSSFTSALIP